MIEPSTLFKYACRRLKLRCTDVRYSDRIGGRLCYGSTSDGGRLQVDISYDRVTVTKAFGDYDYREFIWSGSSKTEEITSRRDLSKVFALSRWKP